MSYVQRHTLGRDIRRYNAMADVRHFRNARDMLSAFLADDPPDPKQLCQNTAVAELKYFRSDEVIAELPESLPKKIE